VVEGIQFGSAHMPVGDENERNETCGGFGTVAGVGTHGGFVFQVEPKESGGADREEVARRTTSEPKRLGYSCRWRRSPRGSGFAVAIRTGIRPSARG